MTFDTFEVLYEFNKSIHHGVLCLEALTKHDGFDPKTISTADVVKAKAAANAYLIGVIGAAESNSVDGAKAVVLHARD